MNETSPVHYAVKDGVATIMMDDGKANVMSLAMLQALSAALDRAESEAKAVLLLGRPRMFSAGYDLALFGQAIEVIGATLRAGGELVTRLFGFPLPVVAATSGHSIAQGAFLMLACDLRFAAAGKFKIGLNEVAIGLTMPRYGVELSRARLTPPGFHHATLTGTLYGPEAACAAGFVDSVVDPEALLASAETAARQLTEISQAAHAGTKQRVRGDALQRMREGVATEFPRPA